MNIQTTSRLTSQELTAQITRHIEEIAEATDTAKVSAEMLRYLETTARFHKYSIQNIWLIMMACPHATRVAGFHQWKSMNRFVRKGEHGIPILAPIFTTVKESDTDAEARETGPENGLESRRFLTGFKVVRVFDISQTDGDPLPDLNWTSREKLAELHERLVSYAQGMGITVTVKELHGETQGISKGGSIEISPDAGTATLIHELAHELLHKSGEHGTLTRQEREIEAEAVAFVVSRHFGLENKVPSANYLAIWSGSKESILAHLERIHKAAVMIIEGIDQVERITTS